MLYLKNIQTPQDIYLPKCRLIHGDMVLVVTSTVNQSEIINKKVTDLWFYGLYHKVSIALPANIPSGEYRYALSDDRGILSSGLLIIGESSAPTEYNKTVQDEQY